MSVDARAELLGRYFDARRELQRLWDLQTELEQQLERVNGETFAAGRKVDEAQRALNEHIASSLLAE